jgi:hypothetical protein
MNVTDEVERFYLEQKTGLLNQTGVLVNAFVWKALYPIMLCGLPIQEEKKELEQEILLQLKAAYPATRDARLALGFLRSMAKEHNLDMNRITVQFF